jgi:hypothetical protein
MKKIINTLIFGAILLYLLSGCQKSLDLYVADPTLNGPDTTWQNTITSSAGIINLQKLIKSAPQRDTFQNADSSLLISHNNGTFTCSIPRRSLINNTGSIISGKITVETHFYHKKGDLILANKPTIAGNAMLVTAGCFFIEIRKEGQPNALLPNTNISVVVPNNNINTQHKLFFGTEPSLGQFTWEPNRDSLNTLIFNNQSYQAYLTRFGWINIDYFYDSTNVPMTNVGVKLPTNYTNTNTSVYLAFKEINSVVDLRANVNARKFVSGRIPAGKTAYLIVISKQGNDLFFASETITTAVLSAATQDYNLTPKKTALADIKTVLAGL